MSSGCSTRRYRRWKPATSAGSLRRSSSSGSPRRTSQFVSGERLMPTISGPITADGALVTIAVGVSETLRRMLQRHNLPVPLPSQVRVVLDPASAFTLADEVRSIRTLGVTSIQSQPVLSSASGMKFNSLPVYDLSVALLDDTGHPLFYW